MCPTRARPAANATPGRCCSRSLPPRSSVANAPAARLGSGCTSMGWSCSPSCPSGSIRCPARPPCAGRCRPSTSQHLEQRIAQFVHGLDQRRPPPATSGAWHGQAIDGKAVRGANRHGAKLHLVSLVRHGSARIRKQVRVRDKSNEITAVPDLLAGVDLHGTVTTMDSLLCQQEIAAPDRAPARALSDGREGKSAGLICGDRVGVSLSAASGRRATTWTSPPRWAKRMGGWKRGRWSARRALNGYVAVAGRRASAAADV